MRQFLKKVINAISRFIERITGGNYQKSTYLITAFVALVVVVLGINAFVELTAILKTETLGAFDQNVTDYIVSYRNPALTAYFKFVTDVGDVTGYLIVVGISVLLTIFIFKRWKYIGQIVSVLILATVSNMILKRFIDRARPGIEHMVVVKTLSYPSGHAMSAMAFYGFLIFLIYRFNLSKWLKILITIALALLILSIGISRIYLGVHYPSDILGGFIAGIIWIFFCILIFDLFELFRKDPQT